MVEAVSGMGKNSSRTDKNLSSRVQRVVNDAKIQNATGGSYNERKTLDNLASASTATTTTPMPSNTAPAAPTVKTTNVFAPGSQDTPLSHGAKGGPGEGSNILQTPIDTANPDSIFVRAMLAANPDSRQLLMMAEAYNEMES
jgi:hypothetical protein